MPADRPDAHARSRVPFWAHQLAELLLGVVLLFEGARTGTHVAVVVVGLVLILFALMTEGPLCAWPVIPRKVHRVGDVVFAVLLAASPFLLGIDESIAIVLLEVAALSLLWLAWRSNFSAPVKRRFRKGGTPTAPAPKATPSPASQPAAESAAESAPEAPAKPVPAPEPAPKAPPAVPSARDAGRALGRLRTGGVRAAGRAVGKASAERASEKKPVEQKPVEQKPADAPDPPEPDRADGPDRGDEPSPE